MFETAGKACDNQMEMEVTLEYVRAAKAITHSFITESKLRYLQRHEKLLLLTISRSLKSKAYSTTGEIEDMYALVCEQYEEKPRGHTQFWKYLKNLEKEGIVDLELSHKGGTTYKISILDMPAGILENKIVELLNSPYAYI
jgi:cell division control protein 6